MGAGVSVRSPPHQPEFEYNTDAKKVLVNLEDEFGSQFNFTEFDNQVGEFFKNMDHEVLSCTETGEVEHQGLRSVISVPCNKTNKGDVVFACPRWYQAQMNGIMDGSTQCRQARNLRKVYGDSVVKLGYSGTTSMSPNHRHHFGTLMLWVKMCCFDEQTGEKKADNVRLLRSYRNHMLRQCMSVACNTGDSSCVRSARATLTP
jgi:hypothetical protein